jgi:pyruvate formate lyase activating enzyme
MAKVIKACIFNIQKYSIHDGPGIRTVVFFKGCPLRCMWCSNPESQNKLPECQNKSMKGEYLTLSDVLKEVLKDKVFYEESNGGVTLSGGEVLMQYEFASRLLKLLRAEKIHTAIETSGYASNEIFKNFIKNVDLIFFDVKHYDREKHFQTTGVYNDIILENLKTALELKKEVIIRIPVIPDINSGLKDAEKFCELLKTFGAIKVNLLPFHQLGERKYKDLGKSYKLKGVPPLHEEDLIDYKNIFIKNGFDCYF